MEHGSEMRFLIKGAGPFFSLRSFCIEGEDKCLVFGNPVRCHYFSAIGQKSWIMSLFIGPTII